MAVPKVVSLALVGSCSSKLAGQLASASSRRITKFMTKVIPCGCGTSSEVTSAAREIVASLRAALGREKERGAGTKGGSQKRTRGEDRDVLPVELLVFPVGLQVRSSCGARGYRKLSLDTRPRSVAGSRRELRFEDSA